MSACRETGDAVEKQTLENDAVLETKFSSVLDDGTDVYSYTPPPLELEKMNRDDQVMFRYGDSGYDSLSPSAVSTTKQETEDEANQKDDLICTLRRRLHYSELHNIDLMEEVRHLQEENETLTKKVNEMSREDGMNKTDNSLVMSWIASPGSADGSNSLEKSPGVGSLKVELARVKLELIRLEEELREGAEERYSIVKCNEGKERLIQEMRESLNVLNEQLLETMNDKENLELLLEDKEAALESLTKHCEELKEIASQRRPVDALATPPGMIKYFCPNDSPEESLDFVEEKCDGFGTDLGTEVIDLQLQEVKLAREKVEQKLQVCEKELSAERNSHLETQKKLEEKENAFKDSEQHVATELKQLKQLNAHQTLHLQIARSAEVALERSLKQAQLKICNLALGPKQLKRRTRSAQMMTELTMTDLSVFNNITTELKEKEELIADIRSVLKDCKEKAAHDVEHARLSALKESESRFKRTQTQLAKEQEDFKCLQANRTTLAEARCMQLEQEVDNLSKELERARTQVDQVQSFTRRGSKQFSPLPVQKRCECIKFKQRQQQFISKDETTVGNKSLLNASKRSVSLPPKSVRDTLPRIPLAANPNDCKKVLTPPRSVRSVSGNFRGSLDFNSSRMSELNRRNSMVLPHMKSCYPSEFIVVEELEVENVFKVPDPVPKVRTSQILRDVRSATITSRAQVRPSTARDIPGERSSSRRSFHNLR